MSKTRGSLVIFALSLLGAGCDAPRRAVALEPGTYTLAVIQGACEFPPTEETQLSGTLVILDHDVAMSDLPADVRDYFDHDYRPYKDNDGPPNGCFVLRELYPSNQGPYVDTGLIHWSVNGKRGTVFAYRRSADWGYEVAIAHSESVIRGTAEQWHAPSGSLCQPDEISATLRGDASIDDCIRAAREILGQSDAG